MGHSKDSSRTAASGKVPSKDLPTLPPNFTPVFIQNQFRTTIELPERPKFPSLEGQVAIITGSNTGLGFEAARQHLHLGLSRLIVAVRSAAKGREAAALLQKENPQAAIDVWALDMESYDSVKAFVEKCRDELPRLDIAVLNAGISKAKFALASSGHETTVQVNHFGTALLALLLLPVFKEKAPARGGKPGRLTIVNSIMSSLCAFATRNDRPVLATLDDPKKWDANDRYGVSKLMNQFFLIKLAERVSPDAVVINMVDPGLTKGTSLFQDLPAIVKLVMRMFMGIAGRPVDRGAATYVHATVRHDKTSHGCFLMNAEIAPLATIYYSPEGKEIMEHVWEETLKEPAFAGAEGILAQLS